MVKLIIRDDDCNFFTRPEDLEHVYRSISDFPVTFAVVPEVTDVYGGCPDTMNNTSFCRREQRVGNLSQAETGRG